MAWWIWIILGAVFLGAEVIIAADFYLVFFGVAGIVVGLARLLGLDWPAWGQWLLYAGIAIVGLVFYRRRLRAWISRPDRDLDEELLGKLAVVQESIAAGALGQVELRGSRWQARNLGDVELAEGTRCEVVAVDGLTLHVKPGE